MNKLSFYNSLFDKEPKIALTVEQLVNAVKNGQWRSQVEACRDLLHDKEAYRNKKASTLPIIRVGGVFEGSTDDSILSHSGVLFLDLDITDNNTPETLKEAYEAIKADPYCAGIFKSVSGIGFAAMVRVNILGDKGINDQHRHWYEAVLKYYRDLMPGVDFDASCRNISRARFVSYDPDAFIKDSKVFDVQFEDATVSENKAPKSDVDPREVVMIGDKLTEINPEWLCKYEDWLKVAFLLADCLGQDGEAVFLRWSEGCANYDQKAAEEKYFEALISGRGDVGIGSLYHMASENNIKIKDGQPRLDAGASLEDMIVEYHSIKKPSLVDQFMLVEAYVKERLKPRFNMLTKETECNGVMFKESDLASALTDIRHTLATCFLPSKNTLNEAVDGLAQQSAYHPIVDYAESVKHLPYNGEVEKVIDSMLFTSTLPKSEVAKVITKWMVSIPAGLHDPYKKEVMLVLAGEQGTGKSHFFETLLPEKLRKYVLKEDLAAQSSNPDFLQKVCQSLIVVDDELASLRKAEWASLKALVSTDRLKFRKAYARRSEEAFKLCMFGGTTNVTEILADETGNRRFLVIMLDQLTKAFNAIDKEALFAELYRRSLKGQQEYILDNNDHKVISTVGKVAQVEFAEDAAIETLFQLPTPENISNQYIIKSNVLQKIVQEQMGCMTSLQKIKKALTKAGFSKVRRRVDGEQHRGYVVASTDFRVNSRMPEIYKIQTEEIEIEEVDDRPVLQMQIK